MLLPLVACTRPAVAPAPAPSEHAVAPRAAPAVAPFHGVLASRTSHLITAELDGAVTRLGVRPGDVVEPGATLAEIDQTLIATELEAARANEDSAAGALLSARAMRNEAGRVLRLQKGLLRDGAVSRDSVAAAASAYTAADAQVQIAEGSVRRMRATTAQVADRKSHAVVRAPIGGVVSTIKLSVGQMAMRGQPIARVSDATALELRFAVPRDQHDRIVVGARVTATLKGLGTPVTAIVRNVGRTLEPPLQFAIVDAELEGTVRRDLSPLLGAIAEVTLVP